MRVWTPRHPSAGVRRRIFGEAEEAPPGLRVLLRTLVPVAACLIVSVAVLNPPDRTGDSLLTGPSAVASLSLSNQSYAAYLPGSFACTANRLDTFRWTNGGGFPSSTFSISPGKAND